MVKRNCLVTELPRENIAIAFYELELSINDIYGAVLGIVSWDCN